MALGVYLTWLTLSILSGTSLQQSSPCPQGWSQFQNTCYLHVENQEVTWDEATTRCADHDAILAEPDTREKLQFLSNITDGWYTWLGGTDRRIEGVWLWSDSERRIDSSLWFPGQPDAWDRDEDCLLMYDEGVCDGDCKWVVHYVCEKQATM